MARPIKITEEMAAMIQAEFMNSLTGGKMFDGTIKFTKTLSYDKDGGKAYITFTVPAFAKMQMLIQSFDSEVAWHGVATREEGRPNSFIITDILVYPQIVAGATVNTDQEQYQTWLYSFDDEVFNNIRMQGHSHVNFSTSPSVVDTEHQGKILEQLDDDMFYIFMIWNKKLEHTLKIYDLQNNVLYENKDIVVHIGSDGLDLVAFVDNARKLCKPRYAAGAGYNQYNKGSTPPVTPHSGAYSGTGKQPAYNGGSGSAAGSAQKSTPATNTAANKETTQVVTKPKNPPVAGQPAIGRGWSGQSRYGAGNAGPYPGVDDYDDEYGHAY